MAGKTTSAFGLPPQSGGSRQGTRLNPETFFRTAITSRRYRLTNMNHARTPDGKLILVTAMTPTPQGEARPPPRSGSETLCAAWTGDVHLHTRTIAWPYFGVKGAARARACRRLCRRGREPAFYRRHVFGDKANNLLAAMVDNHLQHGNELSIDQRRVVLRRVIDLNDARSGKL